jgi:hypothetical protein
MDKTYSIINQSEEYKEASVLSPHFTFLSLKGFDLGII